MAQATLHRSDDLTHGGLHTIEDAAELLAIHHKTLRRYVAEGRIGSVRIGCNRRIPHACLVEFVRAGYVKNHAA